MTLTLTDRKQVRPLIGAIVRTYIAASAVQLGEAVYIDASDQVVKAQANLAATSWARGIVVSISGVTPGSAAAAGDEVGVCVFGPVAGWSGLVLTSPIYISAATAGVLTQTAPTGAATWTHVIANPIAADVLFVLPNTTAPSSNS